MRSNFYPVMITGMHRSGTSLIARVLRECDIFMGVNRGAHDEAHFFVQRNLRIFCLAHAAWDNPKPVKHLLDCQAIRSMLVTSLKREVTSSKAIGYLGLGNYVKSGSLMRMNHPWGWKDPRNTYTLPIWLDVFGNAKVIHVYRNGIDVASSLRAREWQRQNKSRNPLVSCRCMTLEGAFELWAEYEYMGLKIAEELGPDRVLRIRYEDFLTAPREHLNRVLHFVQAPCDSPKIDRAIHDVRPDRAYAFLSSDELRVFYEKKRMHDLMKQFGYDRASNGNCHA
jgi:hypothetical protein